MMEGGEGEGRKLCVSAGLQIMQNCAMSFLVESRNPKKNTRSDLRKLSIIKIRKNTFF